MTSWTPEHNKYMSRLLNDVTGTEEMVTMRQNYCKISDCLESVNPSNANVYLTGSKAEGLDLPGSDVDYMYDINNEYDIAVSESTPELVNSIRENKLLIVTDNVSPCFVFLKCISPPAEYLLPSIVNMGGNAYLSSQNFLSSLPLIKSDREICRIQGPSLEVWGEYADTSESGRDNVPSILCKFWPTSAAEWKVRQRHYGWPSQKDKENIEQFGCHLVPVGHPFSRNKYLEWRLSFSIAERTLVWSFNHTQIQCYAVMKLLLKEYVKTKSAEQYKNVLCSYFIKTFLFWQFETTDNTFWQSANLIGCLLFLFREFKNCIETGVLRHYFIPHFNLLEIKLTPDAQIELTGIFGEILELGLNILGQCNSLSRVFSKFHQSIDSRQYKDTVTGNPGQCIVNNDKYVMEFLAVDVLDMVDLGDDVVFLKVLPELVRLTIIGYVATPLSSLVCTSRLSFLYNT